MRMSIPHCVTLVCDHATKRCTHSWPLSGMNRSPSNARLGVASCHLPLFEVPTPETEEDLAAFSAPKGKVTGGYLAPNYGAEAVHLGNVGLSIGLG